MNSSRISGLVATVTLFAISMQTWAAQDTAAKGPENPRDADTVKVRGALTFTYFYADFSDDNQNKGGDMTLTNYRLAMEGRHGDLSLDVEFTLLDLAFYYAWVGYRASDAWQWQLGVTQNPFGLLNPSHSYVHTLLFFIGFEDDNDLGLKTIWDQGGWNLQLAFFKNEEWGDAAELERTSFDVVVDSQANEESNQVNCRLARVLKHGKSGSSEIGLSGQWGGIYNSVTKGMGDMWAAAAHFNGEYGPLNLQLEAISYRYHPDNPAGIDGRTIEMGGRGVSNFVASEAEIYLVNLSYDVPVRWGPIGKLTFYNDYSILAKRADFPDSHFNTTGCYWNADPLYGYVDYFHRKNGYLRGEVTDPYGPAADADGDWHSRFNFYVGYSFNF